MSLDLYDISDNSQRTQVFYNSGYYNIPKNATNVMIVAIGAGGGGGNGFSNTAGTTRGGGGGGGAGAITRVILPVSVITDQLFITVGTGGAANTAGTATTVDCARGTNTIMTRLLVANAGSGGLNGTGASLGNGGNGGLSSALTAFNLSHYGNYSSSQSQSGGNGGTQNGGVGALVSYGLNVGFPISSGSGGAGIGTANTPFAGGNINVVGVGFFLTNPGGTTISVTGNTGSFSLSPFKSIGGSGGASSATVGGNGGNGTIGSGGGGGGAGVTGGTGGRGGNGLVIISWW